MSEDKPTAAEELIMAALTHMLRNGTLCEQDLIDISADLSRKAEDTSVEHIRERLESAAHLANCVIFEVNTQSDGDWRAEQQRKRLRVIHNDPE